MLATAKMKAIQWMMMNIRWWWSLDDDDENKMMTLAASLQETRLSWGERRKSLFNQSMDDDDDAGSLTPKIIPRNWYWVWRRKTNAELFNDKQQLKLELSCFTPNSSWKWSWAVLHQTAVDNGVELFYTKQQLKMELFNRRRRWSCLTADESLSFSTFY